jgi:hypothetical protein
MEDIRLRTGLGSILTRPELEARLRWISGGRYEWNVRLESAKKTHEPLLSAYIDFSNPGPIDLPNSLQYRFPVIGVGPWGNTEPLICLHPALADPQRHGLYFEGEELKCDYLEDFRRFWPRLREVI